MTMKTLLYNINLIVLFGFSAACFAQNAEYFYSGGSKRYFSIDSTSLNLIVADTADISAISSNIANVFYGNNDTLIFCEEDDNIIIKSKELPKVSIDLLIRTITNNHGEKIKFYAYSTVSNGHRFWLRNEVVSKANSSEALSSLLGVISNYNVDSVWIEDSLYLYAICPNFEDVISLTNSIYESGFVFFSEPDYYFDYEDHYNDPLYNEQFYLHNTGQIISSVCNEVCSAGIDLKV